MRQELTSIIIVTYNKLEYNKLCIDSIRQFTEPASYEIIIVDNHSTDGTAEWLQELTDIRLILNSENVGFPAGCNQGIAAATGNSILLLNNDTIVTPRWLSNLQQCLFSANDIGAVGAVTNSCSNFQSIACEYTSIAEMIRFSRRINRSNPELWENRARLVGYCMLIKTEVINKIGLMDEIFSPGNFEDDDYSLRIRNAGYRLILCRDTFIHHFGSVSFSSFGEQAARFRNLLETNKQKFIAKWNLDPHLVPSSEPIQDAALKKWFAYQHDFNYHRQLMENTYYKFYSILDQAEFALLSGDQEKALSLVMKAADHAHHSHPGFFISPKLELMLRAIAQKLTSQMTVPFANSLSKNSNKRNIIHVLSQGYASGGHTKTLERWITLDTNSVHSIAVTLNSTTNPHCLATAAMQSGGWYYTLDTLHLSLYQRAKMLRDMAYLWADLVVLHVHPHDPIPPVAFGVPGGPPVLFVNHADHAFTIGMSIADFVAEHRPAGQVLTRSRRNIAAAYRLPLPLEIPYALETRQTAKQQLGIAEDRIVFLTIARPYQLAACGEYNFIRLLEEISSRHSHTEFLVAGPADSGEWTQLKEKSNGRIRAVGAPNDLRTLHSAADIYLDSVPLGAPAEALLAGGLGIPVIGLSTELALQLSSDIEPGIQTHFDNRDELFKAIDELVTDAAHRSRQASCLQTAILQGHCSGWIAAINQLYAIAPASHTLPEISANQEQAFDRTDIIWSYFQQQSGLSRSSFM